MTTTVVDTTDWTSGSDSNFDISFKYPTNWVISTTSDKRGIYSLTVTDSSWGSDFKNQVKISFTSHQNCSGNGYDQPEILGLKVSDGKWSYNKTSIGRTLCFPDKQFYIRMTAVSAQAKNIAEQILSTIKFNPVAENSWKKFFDRTLGLEFEYPAYLGHVIVEKANSMSCPEMKTYARNGQLEAEDYLIWFSNLQHIGTSTSYVEYYIPLIKTENSTMVCGIDLVELRKNLASNPQYQSSAFPQLYATDAYVSTIGTTIGTSANQFYTLYFIKRNSMVVIQPDIRFMPVANSNEENEIVQKETTKDMYSSIINYVLKSDSAKPIRNYMDDFKKVVASMKIVD
jgi:hypothetical protein